ncbi:MAG: AAA family ATPase [Umezawaea sp.]
MARVLRVADPGSADLEVAGELVGRERELAVLADHADAARAGTVRGVLVRGPRGAGKSTLLRREVIRQARLGSTVLHTTGRGDRSSLSAARDLLEPAGIAVATPAGSDPDSVYAVFRSLHHHIADLAARAPLCLVIDDLCLCDHATLQWIDFLVRRAADLPLLVLAARGTGSGDRVDGVVADLIARPCCAALELDPLSPEHAAELVSDVLGGTPDEEFTTWCHRLAGGNPGHLLSLLADLRSGGARPDEFGWWRVDGISSNSISAVLGRRLQDTPVQVRVVAAAAAVLEPAERGFLHSLTGLAGQVVDDAVAVLRREHLVDDGVPSDLRECFRRAVLDALPTAEVDALRARAAVLLDDGGRPVEEVARHLVEMTTLNEPWMSRILRAAAVVVSEQGAPDTAARYLSRVLDGEPDNIAVRIEFAEQTARTDPTAAFRQMSAAFEHTANRSLRARLAVMSAHLGTEPEAARAMLAAVLRELDEPPEAYGAADSRDLVVAALLEIDLADRATAKNAFALARDVTPPSGVTAAERCLLGVLSEATMWLGGTAAVAVAQARRALTDQASCSGVGATLAAATVLRCAGETSESIAVLDRAVDDLGQRGEALALSRVLAHRAMTLLAVGDLLGAERDAIDAFAFVERHSWHDHELRPRIALATVAVHLGQTERAEELLDGVPHDRLVTRTKEYHEFLHARAWTRFGRDDLDGALDDLYRCGRAMSEVEMYSPVLVQWWADAAVMAAVLGRREDVVSVVLDGANLFERWITAESAGLSLMARGLVTTRHRAVDLVARSVECFAALPSRVQHARAQVLLGWACLRAGDERVARAQLRSAVVIALRCDHRPLADRARQLLLDAGGRMRMSDEAELGGLTASEHRVAGMAAAGATNREIANTLFVTLRTVELHLTRVYRKLGLSGRSELSSALGFREDLDVLAGNN